MEFWSASAVGSRDERRADRYRCVELLELLHAPRRTDNFPQPPHSRLEPVLAPPPEASVQASQCPRCGSARARMDFLTIEANMKASMTNKALRHQAFVEATASLRLEGLTVSTRDGVRARHSRAFRTQAVNDVTT